MKNLKVFHQISTLIHIILMYFDKMGSMLKTPLLLY